MKKEFVGRGALERLISLIKTSKQDKTDKNLKTKAKDIVGAINEVNEAAKQKEIVVVDIQKMLEEQDTTFFMDLSRRYANGEIVLFGFIGSQTGIVSGIDFQGEKANWAVTSGVWGTPTLEGGEFEPAVTVYGLECDGEKIVIGSGSIEKPDLADYVKFTDIAKDEKAGTIKSAKSQGFVVTNAGVPTADVLRGNEYDNLPITGFISKGTFENIKTQYVKQGVTTNTETWTDEEKASACETIGAVPKWAVDAAGYTTVLILQANGTYTKARLVYGKPLSSAIACYTSRGAGNSVLGTGTPVNPTDCANKDFVENLPDYFTPTDEQKAKWQGMIGETRLYIHNVVFNGTIEEDGSDVSYNTKFICCRAEPFTTNTDIASYFETEPILWYWTDFENPVTLLRIIVYDGFVSTMHVGNIGASDFPYNSFTDTVEEI